MKKQNKAQANDFIMCKSEASKGSKGWKKQVCVAFLGLGLVMGSGCGMPSGGGFYEDNLLADARPVEGSKMATIGQEGQQKTLAPQLKWKVATVQPQKLATGVTTEIDTMTKMARIPGIQNGTPEALKVSSAPKTELAPGATQPTQQGTTVAKPEVKELTPKPVCRSGMEIVKQDDSGQTTLAQKLELQWNLGESRVGQKMSIFLKTEQDGVALVKIAGEQPTEILQMSEKTWQLVFNGAKEAGPNAKELDFRFNGALYRLTLCYQTR